MATVLLVAIILAAAAACPAMAMIQRRRGRAGCCPPRRLESDGLAREGLTDLKAERERVRKQITRLERNASTRDPAQG